MNITPTIKAAPKSAPLIAKFKLKNGDAIIVPNLTQNQITQSEAFIDRISDAYLGLKLDAYNPFEKNQEFINIINNDVLNDTKEIFLKRCPSYLKESFEDLFSKTIKDAEEIFKEFLTDKVEGNPVFAKINKLAEKVLDIAGKQAETFDPAKLRKLAKRKNKTLEELAQAKLEANEEAKRLHIAQEAFDIVFNHNPFNFLRVDEIENATNPRLKKELERRINENLKIAKREGLNPEYLSDKYFGTARHTK